MYSNIDHLTQYINPMYLKYAVWNRLCLNLENSAEQFKDMEVILFYSSII